jgi:hypothetical protein
MMPDENRLLLVLFEHRPIFYRQESLLRMRHTGFTAPNPAFTLSIGPANDRL